MFDPFPPYPGGNHLASGGFTALSGTDVYGVSWTAYWTRDPVDVVVEYYRKRLEVPAHAVADFATTVFRLPNDEDPRDVLSIHSADRPPPDVKVPIPTDVGAIIQVGRRTASQSTQHASVERISSSPAAASESPQSSWRKLVARLKALLGS